MDIREEIKQKYMSRIKTDDEGMDVADFILSKSTLELLKPLYEADSGKIREILRRKTYYEGEAFNEVAKALSDGDVVGVRK